MSCLFIQNISKSCKNVRFWEKSVVWQLNILISVLWLLSSSDRLFLNNCWLKHNGLMSGGQFCESRKAKCLKFQWWLMWFCSVTHPVLLFSFAVRQVNPCENNACDVNARCIPTPAGASQCFCNHGYEGNGFSCRGKLLAKSQLW